MADSECANLVLAGRPCSNCGFLQPPEFCGSAYAGLPSLPSHLITTNAPPSEVDASEIRDIMDASRTCISNLDASIDMLEGTLEKLRKTRKDAIEHLRRSTSVLYMRNLPDDVLGEIFSHTVPDTKHRRTLDKSPWVLGRVCSRWRAISLSHSALWSNIDWSLPAYIRTTHLERSNACGLTMRLHHRDFSDADAIRPLVDSSSRWETVDLCMGFKELTMLDGVHGKVPVLRELHFAGSAGVDSYRVSLLLPSSEMHPLISPGTR
ncbi:hypothetical protein FB451DRAFT_142321 [Mycena latifolia]|nr:hypothetical protein FB451DRAFT_142321 [Mycena latifolia]